MQPALQRSPVIPKRDLLTERSIQLTTQSNPVIPKRDLLTEKKYTADMRKEPCDTQKRPDDRCTICMPSANMMDTLLPPTDGLNRLESELSVGSLSWEREELTHVMDLDLDAAGAGDWLRERGLVA